MSKPVVETVYGENQWWEWSNEDGVHGCYFCNPGGYPPMPEFHTLCARCGQFIFTPEIADDPMNEAMIVCENCDEEMANEG